MIVLGLILYLIAFVIVGAFIRDLRLADDGDVTDNASAIHARSSAWRIPSVPRIVLISATVIGSLVVWRAMETRPLDEGHGDIAVLWLLTIALAIVATAWPIRRLSLARFLTWIRTYRFELLAISALTLGALVIRTVALDRYTWLYSSDEGAFGASALNFLNGTVKNPFQTGWLSHPSMWFYLQAALMRVFGDGVAGSRMLSALMGTATIPVTYLFVRRHMGVPTALTAAALVAVFHFHVFWSRNDLNNISSTVFVVLVLWLLDRVIDEWRPLDALLAGLAVGLSQFGYASNRLLVGLAMVYLVYAAIAALPQTREELESIGFKVLSRGLLIAAGTLLGVLPLAAFYVDHPETRDARLNEVSVFGSGWLDREKMNTGKSAATILWGQFKNAALMPFNTHPSGFYIIDPPFVGWPLVIPIAVGIVLVTIGVWKRRYVGLATAFWATVVGLALTEGRPQSNRYVMAASLLPILGAIGIVEFARALVNGLRLPRVLVGAVVIVAVAGIGYWNLNLYFDDSNPAIRQTDPNVLAADTFAYDLKGLGKGYTVYYAGAPRMYWNGHPSLPFIARGETGLDVDDPWTAASEKPELTGPTVFFFIPERRDELAVVQNWYPNGELIERVTPDGNPLYTEYIVRPDSAAAAAP